MDNTEKNEEHEQNESKAHLEVYDQWRNLIQQSQQDQNRRPSPAPSSSPIPNPVLNPTRPRSVQSQGLFRDTPQTYNLKECQKQIVSMVSYAIDLSIMNQTNQNVYKIDRIKGKIDQIEIKLSDRKVITIEKLCDLKTIIKKLIGTHLSVSKLQSSVSELLSFFRISAMSVFDSRHLQIIQGIGDNLMKKQDNPSAKFIGNLLNQVIFNKELLKKQINKMTYIKPQKQKFKTQQELKNVKLKAIQNFISKLYHKNKKLYQQCLKQNPNKSKKRSNNESEDDEDDDDDDNYLSQQETQYRFDYSLIFQSILRAKQNFNTNQNQNQQIPNIIQLDVIQRMKQYAQEKKFNKKFKQKVINLLLKYMEDMVKIIKEPDVYKTIDFIMKMLLMMLKELSIQRQIITKAYKNIQHKIVENIKANKIDQFLGVKQSYAACQQIERDWSEFYFINKRPKPTKNRSKPRSNQHNPQHQAQAQAQSQDRYKRNTKVRPPAQIKDQQQRTNNQRQFAQKLNNILTKIQTNYPDCQKFVGQYKRSSTFCIEAGFFLRYLLEQNQIIDYMVKSQLINFFKQRTTNKPGWSSFIEKNQRVEHGFWKLVYSTNIIEIFNAIVLFLGKANIVESTIQSSTTKTIQKIINKMNQLRFNGKFLSEFKMKLIADLLRNFIANKNQTPYLRKTKSLIQKSSQLYETLEQVNFNRSSSSLNLSRRQQKMQDQIDLINQQKMLGIIDNILHDSLEQLSKNINNQQEQLSKQRLKQQIQQKIPKYLTEWLQQYFLQQKQQHKYMTDKFTSIRHKLSNILIKGQHQNREQLQDDLWLLNQNKIYQDWINALSVISEARLDLSIDGYRKMAIIKMKIQMQENQNQKEKEKHNERMEMREYQN